jgi:hypothetical protein
LYPGSDRLNLDYIDNVVDFLRRARDHGLVVMIASNTLPDDSYWLHATANLQDDQFQSANNEFLNPRAVPLYVDYWTKVVARSSSAARRLEVIWAYQLRQEHHFQAAFRRSRSTRARSPPPTADLRHVAARREGAHGRRGPGPLGRPAALGHPRDRPRRRW